VTLWQTFAFHAFIDAPRISTFLYALSTADPADLLSEGGETQRCGWLKDRYGVSWQVIPPALDELLHGEDAEKSRKVMQAMLQMDKINIETLKQAYEQEE